jgi:hypothetical protein
MQTPENIEALRQSLLEAYTMLRQDPKRVVQVGELANTAGKVIGTLKLELEYANLRKETPNIAFLNYKRKP